MGSARVTLRRQPMRLQARHAVWADLGAVRNVGWQDQGIARPQLDRLATARQVEADAPAHDAQHLLVSVLVGSVGAVRAVTPLVRLQALIRVESFA